PKARCLPVVVTRPAKSLEEAVAGEVGRCLVNPETLRDHLDRGHFFVVLDGVSESDWTADQLREFHQQYGHRTRLLVTSRPSPKLDGSRATAGARWVEPCLLDDTTLNTFVSGYCGTALSEEHKRACRGPDGYLPLLVRMALDLCNKPIHGVA